MKLPATTTLAERVQHIRRECFGDDDGIAVAKALGLPPTTWRNYEQGVAMPAPVLLAFIELTSANPLWLLTGEGDERSSGSVSGRRPGSCGLATGRTEADRVAEAPGMSPDPAGSGEDGLPRTTRPVR